jgi:hypothetical protein
MSGNMISLTGDGVLEFYKTIVGAFQSGQVLFLASIVFIYWFAAE